MLTTLVILATLAVLFYKYVVYRQNYWERKGIKGPKPTFFFGNFLAPFLQQEAFPYSHDRIYK